MLLKFFVQLLDMPLQHLLQRFPVRGAFELYYCLLLSKFYGLRTLSFQFDIQCSSGHSFFTSHLQLCGEIISTCF